MTVPRRTLAAAVLLGVGASLFALRAFDDERAPPTDVRLRWVDPADLRVRGEEVRACYSNTHAPRLRADGLSPAPTMLELVVELDGVRRSVELERGSAGVYRGAAVDFDGATGLATARVLHGGQVVAASPLCWLATDEVLLGETPSDERLAALREASDPVVRLRAFVASSRRAFSVSDMERAYALSLRAAEQAEALGFVGERSRRLFSAAFMDSQRLRNDEAWSLIEHAERLDLRYDNRAGLARNAHLRAWISKQRSELASAAREARRAIAYAEPLEIARILELARAYLAIIYAELGAFDAALEALEAARPRPDAAPHLQSQYLCNRASVLLQAHEAGRTVAPLAEIEELYRRALEVGGDQISHQEQANLLTRQALVALRKGETERARGLLGRLPLDEPEKLGTVRYLAPLVEVQILLRASEFETARERLDALEDTLPRSPLVQPGLRTLYESLYGQLLIATGRGEEGIARLERAIREVEQLTLSRALPRERSALFFRLRDLRARLVNALLDRGRVEDAWREAERARELVLAQIETQVRIEANPEAWRAYVDARSRARQLASECRMRRPEARTACASDASRVAREAEAHYEAWMKSGRWFVPAPARGDGALPRIEAGEGVLSVMRGLDGEWNSFWVTKDGVRHARAADPVRPWIDRVLRCDHVFVVAGESKSAFDVPVRGTPDGPLGAAVSFSLVPASRLIRAGPSRPRGQRRLVVVADTDATLPRSRAAAIAIANEREADLLVGAKASRGAVLDALARATHLHFEGHGSDTTRPWQASLLLAGDARLDAVDLAAVRTSLDAAVLAGCTTGAQAHQLTVGLPEALLLSGGAVLATVEPVADGASARLLADLYDFGWLEDPVRAWSRAVRAAEARGDEVWRSYRLYARAR